MYEIFVQLCQKKGVTPYKVCKDLGIRQSVISNWKNRGTGLSSATLKKIADYFEMPIDYLLGANKIEWKPEEQEVYYIDDDAKELAQFLFDNPEYKILFDASRKVKPEDLKKAVKAIGLFVEDEDN